MHGTKCARTSSKGCNSRITSSTQKLVQTCRVIVQAQPIALTTDVEAGKWGCARLEELEPEILTTRAKHIRLAHRIVGIADVQLWLLLLLAFKSREVGAPGSCPWLIPQVRRIVCHSSIQDKLILLASLPGPIRYHKSLWESGTRADLQARGSGRVSSKPDGSKSSVLIVPMVANN